MVMLAASLLLLSSPVQAQQPVTLPSLPITAAGLASHVPIITLTLGAPAKRGFAARLAKLNALAGNDVSSTPSLFQPQVRNGLFDEINLGYLNGSAAPSPASVTIQFDVALAGATVYVQPLDGGAILAQDADGNPLNSPAGCNLTLNALGQTTFGYQAPPQIGRYQVLIRVGNASSVLPFVVSDPSQSN